MQQRAGLAQAILNDPELVILDEPTSALDPLGRREVREIVAGLKERGKTVLLNSHLLGEIEMTCDQVAILKKGEVVRVGTDGRSAGRAGDGRDAGAEHLSGSDQGAGKRWRGRYRRGRRDRVGIGDEAIIPDLAAAVVGHGGRLLSLIPKRESLEDLFIRVVVETEAY